MNLSRFKALVLSCAATVAFVGCGGGSDSASTTTTPPVATQTGTFIDAPVQGLKYVTATQNGYTDENGTYKYVNGEQIEFFMGNLSLGKRLASALMTPYTMAGDTNISAPSDKAKNIAMLLQNFDANRSDSALLDLRQLKDHDFSDVNLSATTANMETKITALLSALNTAHLVDGATHTLINATTASTAMVNYITSNALKNDKKFTQAYLSGKTFYVVSHWDPEGWVPFTTTFHSNGTLSYYDAPDANETMDYTVLTNGSIKVTSRSSNPDYTTTIKTVTDDYIETTSTDQLSTSEYFFLDKAKADAKLASLQSTTVSVGSGFGAEWLNNRTLWFVILDTEDDNHNGSTADHILVARAFSNGNTTLDFDADGRDIVVNGGTYTLINGAIKILYGSDWEQNKITVINGDKITTTFTASWGSPTTEYLFTTKLSAQAYLAQLVP